MINLLPEPKWIKDAGAYSRCFQRICLVPERGVLDEKVLLELATLRNWNARQVELRLGEPLRPDEIKLHIIPSLDQFEVEKKELFYEQGYALTIEENEISLYYANRAGYINALTSLKQLYHSAEEGTCLPQCEIVDYPSLAVRAIAQTFSWYAGYGRLGFDSQLWGYDEWVEYLNICLDNKINQFNLVMYGYWPFDLPNHDETVFRNVPIQIWNAENRRWLTVHYTHPNLEDPFMDRFIRLAHKLEVKIFAYVGLNSYNGAYSIKHPQARTKPPQTGQFLNDFDSLCLSYPGTVNYILDSMVQITKLGFDGFTLEESEEGFWYCECDECKKRWHATTNTPVEAKHKANMWLLREIYRVVRAENPNCVVGIRAFRQPPLEKDPAFLEECVSSMPKDIMLFWAPGLYVPETEFPKWIAAFGADHIWARDTESNSITSTMGRLYRTFRSNMIRYEDEANEQVIETDIRQHRGSVEMGVHGINGFMFEWFGLFLHLFAHGNYGWGSQMEENEFFHRACTLNFGDLGEEVLYVMRHILTIHESQMPFYTTPFPFQKNKITQGDIPAILAAKENHPHIMERIVHLQERCYRDPWLRPWLCHFDRLFNAERRNAIIYDMALASLRYEAEQDAEKKDAILDEILYLNERDFDIVKEMFFDINPVSETGVKSCMYPYHEIKRLIHNIRHPEEPDNAIICSGIEALGWLWL